MAGTSINKKILVLFLAVGVQLNVLAAPTSSSPAFWLDLTLGLVLIASTGGVIAGLTADQEQRCGDSDSFFFCCDMNVTDAENIVASSCDYVPQRNYQCPDHQALCCSNGDGTLSIAPLKDPTWATGVWVPSLVVATLSGGALFVYNFVTGCGNS